MDYWRWQRLATEFSTFLQKRAYPNLEPGQISSRRSPGWRLGFVVATATAPRNKWESRYIRRAGEKFRDRFRESFGIGFWATDFGYGFLGIGFWVKGKES
ncbi:hypothetical protein QUB25_25960 [Microcoleus sp. B3-D7]